MEHIKGEVYTQRPYEVDVIGAKLNVIGAKLKSRQTSRTKLSTLVHISNPTPKER